MNETQRILFAAAHAGDTQTMINSNLCGLFILLFFGLILLLSLSGVIQLGLNLLFTWLTSHKDKDV